MRIAPSAAALAATVALSATVALAATDSLPDHAKWATYDQSAFLTHGARPAGATPASAEERMSSLSCPATALTITMTYPQGFDSGGPVDRAMAAFAGRRMAEFKAEVEEVLSEPNVCSGEIPVEDYFHTIGSAPYGVSGKAFSALFTMYRYSGGNHPSYYYTPLNLLPDGTELTVGRLFPDPARSLPLLWERVYRDSCSREVAPTAPLYYGGAPCGPAVPPTPPQMGSGASSLDVLGHATLTSMGLTISLDPYEAWYWAAGPLFIDVPKDNLLQMGADPGLWR
jgi:hypothetical protein